jgi:uridylate kinase
MNKLKKILLKLSGEALAGDLKFGYSNDSLNDFCSEIYEVSSQLGTQVGIVVGGGNLFRGLKGAESGMNRLNGIALQAQFNALGAKATVLTSTFMEPYALRYTPDRAIQLFEEGHIIIFAGGTGNPFFTTDTASALKAIEIKADMLLKGTNVDGVYDDDPRKNPNAKKYKTVSFKEVLDKNLKVMDITAFSLCSENNMPIRVFDMHTKGNLKAIVRGKNVGTLVS